MALKITNECINCDVCEPACPNRAISMCGNSYYIDPLKCTECVGQHDEPQCQLLCPVECIVLASSEEGKKMKKPKVKIS